MQRCSQCNSSMLATEKECFSCGAAVQDRNQAKPFGERFRSLLNVLFIVFGIITVASILAPGYAPSLWKTFPGLVVVYLVKSSADHMSQSAINTSRAGKKKG